MQDVDHTSKSEQYNSEGGVDDLSETSWIQRKFQPRKKYDIFSQT